MAGPPRYGDVMSQAKKPGFGTATLADLLAIPEERRHHEIIDGEVVPKDAATPRHGTAQLAVGRTLGPFSRKVSGPRGPGGWWFATDIEVTFAPQQIFRPDVLGWRRERVPELPEDFATAVIPDWVCEVLSTNRGADLVQKLRAYHAARVPHYWVLDPLDFTLTVYRWNEGGYLIAQRAERGERLRPEPFDALEFEVGVFFGDDEQD